MISVIIPTYQSSNTIIQCLESVFGQRGVDVEIIIVDDGSTDDTQALLQPYRDRLTLLTIPHQGAPAARNTGARQAKGTFLFFCDSDTLLEPEALATMSEALRRHPQAAYCYSAFWFINRLMRAVTFSPYWLRRVNYVITMSLLRREDFPGFDETLRRLQDWDLWLTLLERGRIGVSVSDVLFRTLRTGISTEANQPWEEAERLIRLKHQLPFPGRWDRLRWSVEFFLYRRFGWFSRASAS